MGRLVLAALLGLCPGAQDGAPDIGALIRKLSSADEVARQAAVIAIRRVGRDAIGPLSRALEDSRDDRFIELSSELLLFAKSLGSTPPVGAPPALRISVKEVDGTLEDAIARIAASSGIRIGVADPKLQKSRLSIDILNEPLWRALAAVCGESGAGIDWTAKGGSLQVVPRGEMANEWRFFKDDVCVVLADKAFTKRDGKYTNWIADLEILMAPPRWIVDYRILSLAVLDGTGKRWRAQAKPASRFRGTWCDRVEGNPSSAQGMQLEIDPKSVLGGAPIEVTGEVEVEICDGLEKVAEAIGGGVMECQMFEVTARSEWNDKTRTNSCVFFGRTGAKGIELHLSFFDSKGQWLHDLGPFRRGAWEHFTIHRKCADLPRMPARMIAWNSTESLIRRVEFTMSGVQVNLWETVR